MAKKSQSSSKTSQPNENIDIPPVSKRNAGAATGAVIGAVGGPIGAIIGGVVGAVMGKVAASREPVMPSLRRGAKSLQQTAVKSAGEVKAAAKAVRSTVSAVKRAKPAGGKAKGGAKKSGGRKSSAPAARGAKKTKGKSGASKSAKRPSSRKRAGR